MLNFVIKKIQQRIKRLPTIFFITKCGLYPFHESVIAFFFFLCVAGGRGVGPVLNSGLIVGSGMSEREGGEE